MRYFLIAIFCSSSLLAQQVDKSAHSNWVTNLPGITTNHPIGIFMSRSQVNFGARSESSAFQFNYNMGNVWLPKVTAFLPTNEKDKAEGLQYVWHFRGKQNWNSPDSISLQADGVIRTYEIAYDFPIKANQHLSIAAQLFSLDGGKFPFSMLTSDEFIEWFHSNVAGGEDPFARRDYPFNKALINFTDREGNELLLKNGAMGLNRILIQYERTVAPTFLERLKINLRANSLLGVNTSSFNRSVDVGIGIQGTKDFRLRKSNLLRIGISKSFVNVNSFRSNTEVQLTDVDWISQFSFFVGWEKLLKNTGSISVSMLYQIQSSYMESETKKYYALEGESNVSHWHYAISHLYHKTYRNSILIAYQKNRMTYGLSISQDLILADNAPDIQTGLSIRFSL